MKSYIVFISHGIICGCFRLCNPKDSNTRCPKWICCTQMGLGGHPVNRRNQILFEEFNKQLQACVQTLNQFEVILLPTTAKSGS